MYVTNPTSKTPIFQINQHIGFDKDILDENGVITQEGDGQGIDGIVFSQEVLSFNDSDIQKLLFYINSQGGDVQRSLDMFNSIAMSKQKTHAIITGFAFSCAGWIPLAADVVDMVEETGRWMCHMPYNPDNPEEKSQFMDEVVDIISATIAAKSGRNGVQKKTQDEIKKLMRDKTYWNAKRMKDEGLIDNIVTSSGKVVRLEKDPITLNKTELSFYYKEYQVAQNKFITENISKKQNQNIMPFEKAINRLNAIDQTKTGVKINLTNDASEDEVVSAIVKLENRMRSMNDDMMDMQTQLTTNKEALDAAKLLADGKTKEANDAMCSYNSMKEANDKLEMENKSMKEKEEASNKEKADSDLKTRKERATNFVDKLVEQKKIAATESMTLDEVKNYLINKGTENFADIATQFSLSPIKISAPKPGFGKVSNSTNEKANIVENLMASNIERVQKNQHVIEGGIINPSRVRVTLKD